MSRVENMFDQIGGKRASVNLNATLLDMSMVDRKNIRDKETLNLPKLKLFDWILRKLGST